MPGLAHIAAAANVGVGDDEAAVEQAEAVGVEADRQSIAVRAIAIDVERIVARHASCLCGIRWKRESRLRPARWRRDARSVSVAVEAARDLELFEQRRFIGLQHRIHRPSWAKPAIDSHSETCRDKFAVDVGMRAVGGLRKGNLAAKMAANAPWLSKERTRICGRPSSRSTATRRMEEIQVLKHHVVAMRRLSPPVRPARDVERGSDHAKGSGGVVIRE